MQRLPWKLLEPLTPYHAVWNAEGELFHISEPLRKFWKTEEPLSVLQGKMKLLRPFSGIIQAAWLSELTALNLQFTHMDHPDLVIRGQVISYEDFWILVGSPNVHSVAELTKMGLKLSDLPIHDGMGDLLIAVETSLVAHRETEERSRELAKANEELLAVNLALSGFVPPSVLKSLGLEEDSGDDAGTRAEMVGRFIEHLQAAIEFRESFLANMSHELRTPLNAILGVTEVLQEGVYGDLTEKQLEMLHTVENSGDHLLSLINDVLDLSKIEAGEANVRIGEFKLDALCDSALQLIRQQIRNKGLELKFENKSQHETLFVDGRRIRQVLLNLLSNAVKFTDEGHISLRVDDVSGVEMIRFRVEDSGIGISPEDQENLFQPFFQVDHGLSRKYQGTGLGLAITWRTVELHGGQIELESVPGKGSCFSVVLPVKAEKSEVGKGLGKGTALRRKDALRADFTTPDPTSLLAAASPYILVVDDVADNRTHVVDYFQHAGFEVDVAENGMGALQKIFEKQPDLVLLDIQMPGITGLDVIRCLRVISSTRNLPVIALTGSALETDQERCMEAGADAFLAKPCILAELKSLVLSLLDKKNTDLGRNQK